MRINTREEVAVIADLHACAAKLAVVACLHAAAEQMTHQLHAVANSQHGNAKREDRGVTGGRANFEDARRAARKNDAPGLDRANLFHGNPRRDQQAEHARLAHAARNQLGRLAAKVEDENSFGAGRRKVDHGEGSECSTHCALPKSM